MTTTMLTIELLDLESETFEVVDTVDLSEDMAAWCSTSCCSCSTSSCCSCSCSCGSTTSTTSCSSGSTSSCA